MNHWGKEGNYKTQLIQKAGSTIWTGQATCEWFGVPHNSQNVRYASHHSTFFSVF